MEMLERLINLPLLRAGVGLRRRLRGPKRPSWSLDMEIAAEFMRLYSPLLMRVSPERQRKGGAAILKPDRVARRQKRTNVELRGLRGSWFAPPNQSHDGVLYYLHGGGYIIGSLETTHQNLIAGLAEASQCRAFALDYRLAPEHPFPAAIHDAVAGYRFLLEQGIPTERIVIGGDSAGGGLTMSTLLQLREEGLPQPAGAVVISPWVDMRSDGGSMVEQQPYDYISKPYLDLCARLLLGLTDPRHPLASPVHADLTGIAPLLIQVGGSEALLDNALRLAERARAAGVEVELDVGRDMVHVWHIFASFLQEAQAGIDRAGHFVRKQTVADVPLAAAEE